MNKIIVVGSANVDLIVLTETLPSPGETVLGSNVVRSVGGKGANQAVAAARLGAHVAMLAATGDDEFGAEVRKVLANEVVDVSHVQICPQMPTGMALVTVDSNGSNTIVVSRGANVELGRTSAAVLDELVTAGDIVLLQLEIPVPTCLYAATLAREAGATTILNAAPLPLAVDTDLRALLRVVDVLVVNQHEAAGLADSASMTTGASWSALANTLRDQGPSAVVVTLGAEGAILATQRTTEHLPAFLVKVADSTGAGDAFCGAFAAALADGAGPRAATQRGCAAGALAVTKVGAQAALPTAVDLEKLLHTMSDAAPGEPIAPAERPVAAPRSTEAVPQLDPP